MNVTAGIRLPDATSRRRVAHSSAQNAKRVFDRSRRIERRSKEQFGCDGLHVRHRAMPELAPATIRRASLRGQIHTELHPELERVAQTQASAWNSEEGGGFDPSSSQGRSRRRERPLKVGLLSQFLRLHDGLTL